MSERKKQTFKFVAECFIWDSLLKEACSEKEITVSVINGKIVSVEYIQSIKNPEPTVNQFEKNNNLESY